MAEAWSLFGRKESSKCPETSRKDFCICQSLSYAAVTKFPILLSYSSRSFTHSHSHVESCKADTVALLSASSYPVLKEEPVVGIWHSLSKVRRTRGRTTPLTLKAPQTWLLSYLLLFHWPKQVTWPSLKSGQGSVPCGHMS